MTHPQPLQQALALPPIARLQALLAMVGEAREPAAAVADALVALISYEGFSPAQRMALGEGLAVLGDPRLRTPMDADYWVEVKLDDDHRVAIGRYLVTTWEWRAFLDSGAYDNEEYWSGDGLAWRASERPSWLELASFDDSAGLVIPNQPVVGVCWYEAMAYARSQSARLLEFDERVRLIRGDSKRPYPWGQPFGQSNANTREEVLGKPSAVGVFPRDRTPEGIYDLAGNVGEWTADAVGDRRVIHPGSWEQPSMAAWAKALHIVSPAARAADLGFRLARDL